MVTAPERTTTDIASPNEWNGKCVFLQPPGKKKAGKRICQKYGDLDHITGKRALLSLYEVLGRSNASGLVGHFRYEKEDRRTKGVPAVA